MLYQIVRTKFSSIQGSSSPILCHCKPLPHEDRRVTMLWKGLEMICDQITVLTTAAEAVVQEGSTIPQGCLRIASLRLWTSGSGITAVTTLKATSRVGRHLPAHTLVLLWGTTRASSTISLLALLRETVVVLETHCAGCLWIGGSEWKRIVGKRKRE